MVRDIAMHMLYEQSAHARPPQAVVTTALHSHPPADIVTAQHWHQYAASLMLGQDAYQPQS